jgi:predicted Rossmann fold nucleotide-binding protein DprA/Smf involved in DNA uptake
MESTLTADTQAVLLICADLGQRGDGAVKPLGLKQYNALAVWLNDRGLRPGDLLTAQGRARLAELQTAEISAERVQPLLDRGAALAFLVERWQRGGLWVISRSDPPYPERLKKYLGQAAPPLLYGVGPQELLGHGGLAVVGSRDRSEEDGEFARRVGEQCARESVVVISGAAKGIDRDAMAGALEAGGQAVGVLPEGLASVAVSARYRSDLVDERLALVSSYEPDSRWFPYTAMGRNRILYGMSDAALVVASADESGGTWAGATEALRHHRVKVFVKASGTLAPGNRKLLRMGGLPFPEQPWEDIRALFGPPLRDAAELFPSGGVESAAGSPEVSEPVPAPPQSQATEPRSAVSRDSSARDAYTLVIGQVLKLLSEPQGDKWLAEKMGVRAAQMKDWLDKAVREGTVRKLKEKPVRYVATSPTLFSESIGPGASGQ